MCVAFRCYGYLDSVSPLKDGRSPQPKPKPHQGHCSFLRIHCSFLEGLPKSTRAALQPKPKPFRSPQGVWAGGKPVLIPKGTLKRKLQWIQKQTSVTLMGFDFELEGNPFYSLREGLKGNYNGRKKGTTMRGRGWVGGRLLLIP